MTRAVYIVRTILAIIAFTALVAVVARGDDISARPNLTALYAQYNRDYFAGKLPSTVTAEWTDAFRMTFWAARADEYHGHLRIRLDDGLAPYERLTGLVLLHEMVHVKLWPYTGHGTRFQVEMLRLANAGAFSDLW